MLSGSANGYTTLFKFLADHKTHVKTQFRGKKNLWTGIVHSATGSFNTQEGYDMVQQLYKQYDFGEAEALVTEALENIKQETRWSEKNLPAIDKWLTETLAKPQQVDEEVLKYWKASLVCPKRDGTITAPAS